MVDMYKSIMHSCDTYYYVLANDMGIDSISRFMGTLGLTKTGIDIGTNGSGESGRGTAVTGLEEEALQETGTAIRN